MHRGLSIQNGLMYLYAVPGNNGIYYIDGPVPGWLISELDMRPVPVPRILAPRYYTSFQTLSVKGWELKIYEWPYCEVFIKREGV